MSDTSEKLIQLYFEVKKLAILAEETDPEFKEFIQPDGELVRALDHIMRAQAEECGLRHSVDVGEPATGSQGEAGEIERKYHSQRATTDLKYIELQLSKAYGHLYRAFFDSADWYAINLREKIHNDTKGIALEGVSLECLNAVFPEYYRDVRPIFEESSKKIAELRLDKDVANDVILCEVEKYNRILKELSRCRDLVLEKRPLLNDCEERRAAEVKRFKKFNATITIGGAILGAVLGAILGVYLTLHFVSPPQSILQKQPVLSSPKLEPPTPPLPAVSPK